MASHLQIYEPRERALVAAADAVLSPLRWLRRRRSSAGTVQRVLLLRLERIGDLLMVIDAIHDARAAWPDASIDLAVGSWNVPIAALLPGVNRIEVVDAPWLARESAGQTWSGLIRQARGWRARRYDLVLNFEPDIRGNFLAWLSGAPRRVGYRSGGGGAFLTDAGQYHPQVHVAINARALVARAAGRSTPETPRTDGDWPRLIPPADAIERARTVLGTSRRPFIGVHASGGRPSKQWHVDRFAAAARELAQSCGATIVLTGSDSDRAIVDQVRRILNGCDFIDACGGLDLPALAALLGDLDLLVTGDTGPMHLAAAMGTPVVALFGPAHPARYGPLIRDARIVRVDLPCSPCGRVRLPPERCRGHVPDCMDGITVAMVVHAAQELLQATLRNREGSIR